MKYKNSQLTHQKKTPLRQPDTKNESDMPKFAPTDSTETKTPPVVVRLAAIDVNSFAKQNATTQNAITMATITFQLFI
ncbi:MAG: hypothetical protein WC027_03135 [Candidatus Paceibacterota bacterium]